MMNFSFRWSFPLHKPHLGLALITCTSKEGKICLQGIELEGVLGPFIYEGP